MPVYAKLKGLWGLQMLVQGTDLKKATIATAVFLVAASFQGLAENPSDEEPSTPGIFCSEDGVCMVSNTSTAVFRAQGIEKVLNNLDLAVYLVVMTLGDDQIWSTATSAGCGAGKWWFSQ